ncbi:MAG: rhamnulokinase [Spirochaetes bacterium]|nr:rhamnulokinase [Spirochaetota bacterium]
MSEQHIFAVDLGASGGKCFVGTFKGGDFSMYEINRFSHDGVSFFSRDRTKTVAERCYWNDTLLYDNIIKGLHRFRREISDRVDGIGIDTWGTDGGFVTPDGDMAGKIYCYRDHRLDGMMDEVKRRIDPAHIYEITGIHFQPFNVSNQLLWFIQNRRHTLQPGSLYLPMPTVFGFYLGGVEKIDSTWASVTQLMDCRTSDWSEDILKRLGIPHEIMPEIVAPGFILGTLEDLLADRIGLNRAPIIAVASHDTASAYAAAPIRDTKEALIISSGTWSLVGKLIPKPITSASAMKYNLSNEGGIENIRFLKNCMGLWIVQELRRGWEKADGMEMGWEKIVSLVTRAKPFSAFIDPDAPCFFNPPDMEAEISQYLLRTGQQRFTDRGTLLRIVYESLAMKYRTVLEEISDACGAPFGVVHIIGGGCKNELLNQFTADATGLPVFAGPDEATACGNIMVQAKAVGIIPSLVNSHSLILDTFSIKKYEPLNSPQWNKRYGEFTGILTRA